MSHPWHDVTPGECLSAQFTAVFEIPAGSKVKYEMDKNTKYWKAKLWKQMSFNQYPRRFQLSSKLQIVIATYGSEVLFKPNGFVLWDAASAT